MELAKSTKITKGTSYIESRVDDDLVLMDTNSGKFFRLADTGKRAWELLDEVDTYGELIDALCREYEVGEDTCKADTDALIQDLRARKLVSV